MTVTIQLVVDTNLFHECHKLDAPTFPWRSLGEFDEIVLVVSDSVQAELDNQKKDTRPRVKRRAVEAVTWFREILSRGEDEKVLREAGPRVVIRLDATPKSSAHADVLDYDVMDDRIVGVAAALRAGAPNEDIRVLSHDTRPLMKAKALKLPFLLIPEDWIREEEEDDLQKENRRLKEQLKALQVTLPAITIEAEEAHEGVVHLSREGFREPSADEVEELRRQLALLFPLENLLESGTPKPPQLGYGFAPMEYVHPVAAEVLRFRDDVYPNWISSTLQALEQTVDAWNLSTSAGILVANLFNEGSRPAEDLRITFSARGSILLCPPLPPNRSLEVEYPELKTPPRGPKGYWKSNGSQIATIDRSNIVNPRLMDFPFSSAPKLDREDEDFYYEPDRPYAPSQKVSLVCRRFMHGEEAEPFELDVYPQKTETEVRGAVDVTVQASNLSKSVKTTIPVLIETTLVSPLDTLIDRIKYLASVEKRAASKS